MEKISNSQHGFTLIEMIVVVAIIGLIASITYPGYQQYVIKSKRADMMSEMHNIAGQIESRKLAQGSYSDISVDDLTVDYPKQDQSLYSIDITDPLVAQWKITAKPKAGKQMAEDGDLTLNYQGVKCRDSACGTGDEWK